MLSSSGSAASASPPPTARGVEATNQSYLLGPGTDDASTRSMAGSLVDAQPAPNPDPRSETAPSPDVFPKSPDNGPARPTIPADNASGPVDPPELISPDLSRRSTPADEITAMDARNFTLADSDTDSLAVENVTRQECRKLVYALSKELALFCNLSLGLGGTSDSDRLREELRKSRHRVCSLAKQNKHTLIPLLKRKNADGDEREELEKLYRVYSGCLEYLEMQLTKVSNLQAIFPLHTGECLLINTGIAEPTLHRTSVFTIEHHRSPSRASLHNSTGSQEREKEEIQRIKGELEDIQQLLYHVSSTVDIKPWDVSDVEAKPVDGLDEQNDTRSNKTVRISQTITPRQKRVCMWIALGIGLALLVIGVVVGVVVGTMAT